MADFVPPVDDAVVTKLAAAGTISVGKSSTPEFGFPCYTDNDLVGPARCPWDPTRLAGGSSGGGGGGAAAGLPALPPGRRRRGPDPHSARGKWAGGAKAGPRPGGHEDRKGKSLNLSNPKNSYAG